MEDLGNGRDMDWILSWLFSFSSMFQPDFSSLLKRLPCWETSQQRLSSLWIGQNTYHTYFRSNRRAEPPFVVVLLGADFRKILDHFSLFKDPGWQYVCSYDAMSVQYCQDPEFTNMCCPSRSKIRRYRRPSGVWKYSRLHNFVKLNFFARLTTWAFPQPNKVDQAW